MSDPKYVYFVDTRLGAHNIFRVELVANRVHSWVVRESTKALVFSMSIEKNPYMFIRAIASKKEYDVFLSLLEATDFIRKEIKAKIDRTEIALDALRKVYEITDKKLRALEELHNG